MEQYKYSAMSNDGSRVEGVVEASDEFTAVSKIKAQNLPVVINIQQVKQKDMGILSADLGSKKVDTEALSVMCSQFSIILGAGVNIATCMQMISEQTADKKLAAMLRKSADDVAHGAGVAASMERNCEGLPLTFLETVRAGEQSGTMDESFKTLEKYYSKSHKLQQKIKQALSYPMFVIVIAIVVVAVIMIKVVPTMTGVFADFGSELPMITKALVGMSDFFRVGWPFMIALLIVGVGGFKMWVSTDKGKESHSRNMLKIPIIGNINRLNGAAQFANTMSALLRAGLPVSQALDTTGKVMDNYVLGQGLRGMVRKIEEGRRLGDVMRESALFPKTLTEMTAIGEETGELENTLDTIGDYYSNEADHATTQALAKLEPAIMVVLAIFVGWIVLAIYTPMFSMYNLM